MFHYLSKEVIMTTKTFLIVAAVVVALTLPFSPSFAQFPEDRGMDPNLFPPENQNSVIRYGGRYISSTGTLWVLMIWVRFADNNVNRFRSGNPAMT